MLGHKKHYSAQLLHIEDMGLTNGCCGHAYAPHRHAAKLDVRHFGGLLSRLYTYIVKVDSGLAPNPFSGWCTLAVCTPNHQGCAVTPGDWIAGFSPKSLGYQFIYAMKVDERIHMSDYFHDPRFQSKKPVMSGGWKERCGDNFFDRVGQLSYSTSALGRSSYFYCTRPKEIIMSADLFEPFQLGGLTLTNRMVMAPMTRNRADEHGVVLPIMVTYYQQCASAGLFVTESAPVSPEGVSYPFTPGIYTDAQAANWLRVTDAVHSAGGHVFFTVAKKLLLDPYGAVGRGGFL